MKKTAGIGIVLLIIVGGIYFAKRHGKNGSEIAQAPFFPGFSSVACSQILLIDRGDTARLVRKGTSWYVTPLRSAKRNTAARRLNRVETLDYPADSAAIQKALGAIKKLCKEDMVAGNPANWETFEVDTANALFVECRNDSGAALGAVYIGKVGLTSDSYFIRDRGSNNVYSVSGSIRFALFANADRWRDRRILAFDRQSVRKLTIISRGSGTVELVKAASSVTDPANNGVWEIVKPLRAKADGKRLELMVSRLVGLKADAFEGDTSLSEKTMGFDKPSLMIELTLTDGGTRKLIVGNDKVAMKWVRSAEKPDITFTLYSYNIDGFNPGLALLKGSASGG
jgi:hypothetical protein